MNLCVLRYNNVEFILEQNHFFHFQEAFRSYRS